jgi:4-oxalocrotonate tautomerase
MPHVIVKLWPGKSEQQKQRLADQIVKDVMNVLNYGEESVSVAIKEIPAADWAEKVYKPEIIKRSKTLYKRPGYDLSELLRCRSSENWWRATTRGIKSCEQP